MFRLKYNDFNNFRGGNNNFRGGKSVKMEMFPFICDYAKSSRSVCRGCQSKIIKETLRIAIMLQATTFDQKVPNWYHFQCFFIEHMPQTTREIENFDLLRLDDQQEISKILERGESPYSSEEKRLELKRDISKSNSKASVNNYSIEYTQIGRQKCAQCDVLIRKPEIRIKKKMPSKYNVYHLDCFVKVHEELDYLQCGSEMNGFNELSEQDQVLVKQKLPGLCETPPKKKRPSTDQEPEKPLSQQEIVFRDYNNIMHQYRANLKANLKKDELIKLLKKNGQMVPAGVENILDRASDMLTYGALTRCMNCGRGQLIFSNIGYKCSGSLTAWAKCTYITSDPVRNHVKIPQDLKLKHDFLYKYEYVPRKRIIIEPKFEKVAIGPLRYKNILLHGFSKEENTALYHKVNSLAGRVVSEVRRSVFCVISTKEQVKLETKVIKDARECDVYVVSKEFLSDLKNGANLDEIALRNTLVPFGTELHLRIPEQFRKTGPGGNFRYYKEKEEEGKRIMKVKNGIAIEPDSLLDNIAHVYQSAAVVYNAVLSKTDVMTNQNSYYKIQLLESDNFNEYWVYKGWGRIGTKSGSSTVKSMTSLEDAVREFKACFQEKTGNSWGNRHCMKKKRNKYTYVEVNYEARKEEIMDLNGRVADSNLKPAVAQLMAMIFNMNAMEKMMLEYELDLQKMPLGKLSRSQIKAAYNILTEVTWAFQRKCDDHEIIEYTNRFYSCMPHTTALETPPLLDNLSIIKKKSEMLASLMEMETAYSIIQRGANGEGGNPLDAYYNQLKANIEPLEEICDEFKLITEYVNNTHADTHRNYDLKILEIFKVAREGEFDRYQKFNNLPNRRLLWHGSRTTNYAGILSQGLRIAPPEAPVTGYMFGKGIYFADMVSKSANYCCTSSEASEGLLLLCEVALGNIDNKTRAEDIRRLPQNLHSVRGVGKTEPDPNQMKTLEDGVQVPLGKPVQGEIRNTNLMYNEYIVYDVSQVQIKYLLKLDFKFKRGIS